MPSADRLQKCRAALEGLGFRVWVGPNAGKKMDYLGGTDEERAADLNAALSNPEVRGIFCSRGGYGAGRILNDLDYDAARHDVKLFAGFSDITAFHGALGTIAGWSTLHAPTVAYAFVTEGDTTELARKVLVHSITSTEPLGSIRKAMEWTDGQALISGKAEGPLVGGCLSVLVTLLGTPHLPDPRGSILFLEDTGEHPYRLDRYLTHLRMSGFLDAVAGVVLGQFTDCSPEGSSGSDPADVVIARCLKGLNRPVLVNFPVGHTPHNTSLPLGCFARLDAHAADLVVEEALCV
jgi:muramoyltetrapeptide carboxypeptidase